MEAEILDEYQIAKGDEYPQRFQILLKFIGQINTKNI